MIARSATPLRIEWDPDAREAPRFEQTGSQLAIVSGNHHRQLSPVPSDSHLAGIGSIAGCRPQGERATQVVGQSLGFDLLDDGEQARCHRERIEGRSGWPPAATSSSSPCRRLRSGEPLQALSMAAIA